MTERHIAAPATDQNINPSPDPKPETEQEKKSWLDLSPIQVMGGSLAAMTAASLGSRFSVEGTVVGAAFASVIAAVAGALYTASLRRTGAVVRGALGRAQLDRIGSSSIPKPVPSGSTAVDPQTLSSLAGTVGSSAKPNRRRNVLLSSVVGAIAIFALAAGALTTYEALAGRALSGGGGTTFSQVQEDGRGPKDEKAPAPSETADPSESAEPTPAADPSDTPDAESAPTTEPSAEPSVEPSEPSVTSEAEPSATAPPPSSAPSQPAQTPR